MAFLLIRLLMKYGQNQTKQVMSHNAGNPSHSNKIKPLI